MVRGVLGYLLGEHRLLHTSQPYEEAAGIPFAVRGPGVEPRTVDALVSQVDLMPTTLDIADLDPEIHARPAQVG